MVFRESSNLPEKRGNSGINMMCAEPSDTLNLNHRGTSRLYRNCKRPTAKGSELLGFSASHSLTLQTTLWLPPKDV